MYRYMYTNSPAGAAFESQNIYLGDSGQSFLVARRLFWRLRAFLRRQR